MALQSVFIFTFGFDTNIAIIFIDHVCPKIKFRIRQYMHLAVFMQWTFVWKHPWQIIWKIVLQTGCKMATTGSNWKAYLFHSFQNISFPFQLNTASYMVSIHLVVDFHFDFSPTGIPRLLWDLSFSMSIQGYSYPSILKNILKNFDQNFGVFKACLGGSN